MKHRMPKRPTREQKKLIQENGLDWTEWLVKDVDNISMALIHKETNKIKIIFL